MRANLTDCTFATCEHVPELDPDDRVMLDELRERNISAAVAVWSDPSIDWSATRLCMVRSTWDYHARFGEFVAWVERVEAATTICNTENLLRWSAHKSYLRELALAGIPVVPTVWLTHGEHVDLAGLMLQRGWRDVVIKPSLGAAAHDVLLVNAEAAALGAGQTHLGRLLEVHDVLVQPYLKRVVSYGERALVFFRGRYSHAVMKKPFDTMLAISDARSALVEPTDDELAVAQSALDAAPGVPLYARVDLLRDDADAVRVSEVELVEPALYLAVHGPARVAFADAIEDALAALDCDSEQTRASIAL